MGVSGRQIIDLLGCRSEGQLRVRKCSPPGPKVHGRTWEDDILCHVNTGPKLVSLAGRQPFLPRIRDPLTGAVLRASGKKDSRNEDRDASLGLASGHRPLRSWFVLRLVMHILLLPYNHCIMLILPFVLRFWDGLCPLVHFKKQLV